MLKYSLFLFVVFSAISTIAQGWSEEEKKAVKAKIRPIVDACGEEFGISSEQIEEWKKEKKNPDDHNACMFACIYKKIGMLDDKGLFSVENAINKSKKYLTKEEDIEKVVEAANECASVNDEQVSDGEKGCDRAKLIFICMMKQADKFGLA